MSRLQAYFLCLEGTVSITVPGAAAETALLNRHDAAELQYGPPESSASSSSHQSVDFTVSVAGGQAERGHVLVVEMMKEGTGRTDL